MFMGPRNWFQGMNSASLCSLAGRYENPIPPQCLAPIEFLKIPALSDAGWAERPYSFCPSMTPALHLLYYSKGTKDWEFFWLRFWNLYYFFVSYVKILRFYPKKFDWAIIGVGTIFPRSPRTTQNEKKMLVRSKKFFNFFFICEPFIWANTSFS
jgi:hypothetical protein